MIIFNPEENERKGNKCKIDGGWNPNSSVIMLIVIWLRLSDSF